jgi:hypothetical protein
MQSSVLPDAGRANKKRPAAMHCIAGQPLSPGEPSGLTRGRVRPLTVIAGEAKQARAEIASSLSLPRT